MNRVVTFGVSCDNDKLHTRGLSLVRLRQTLADGNLGESAEAWERFIVGSGMQRRIGGTTK